MINSYGRLCIRRVIPVFIFLLVTVCLTVVVHEGMAANTDVSRTGQAVSYVAGDDGDFQKGIPWPTPRFAVNGDGTVTDRLTNLIWLQNGNCAGSVLTWPVALSNADTLASGSCGLSDGSATGSWRLPSIRELESLVHAGVFSPAVPNSAGTGSATAGDPFNQLIQADYWSSTANVLYPHQALAVNMQYGLILSRLKSSSRYALYVRNRSGGTPLSYVYATGQTQCYTGSGVDTSCADTGQDGDLQAGLTWPVPRFTDNGDGTVKDNLSGLHWLKDPTCLGLDDWSGAVSLGGSLRSGTCGLTDNSETGNWRLPNRRELLSLMDYGSTSPALSDTAGDGSWSEGDPFVNIPNVGYFWTSTTYDAFTGHSWYIDIESGIAGTLEKANSAYIWPVRDEALVVILDGAGEGTVTSIPEGIDCPGTCSAVFENSSSVTLHAESAPGSRFDGWSMSSCGNSRDCTIDMSGTVKTVTARFRRMDASSATPSWLILLMN